jgi:hypothetical protein
MSRAKNISKPNKSQFEIRGKNNKTEFVLENLIEGFLLGDYFAGLPGAFSSSI